MSFFKKLLRPSRRRKSTKGHSSGYDPNGGQYYNGSGGAPDFAPPNAPYANQRPSSAHSAPGRHRATSFGFGAQSPPKYSFPTQQTQQLRHGETSLIEKFPVEVLSVIMSHVCPHSRDDTYLTAEETTIDDACMLCDMRDLSHLGLVSRKWRAAMEQTLYRNIRMDSVHYCGKEEELQTRRKRGSFFHKSKDANATMEIPEIRMRLLYRTMQENEHVGEYVRSIKMPYMTRETCKADLARLLSLTPEIGYVDLPAGVYTDDPSCAALKAILHARCPELRKMRWVTGSERDFGELWQERPWPRLEIVELSEMKLENADLVRVLSSLKNLRTLSLESLPWISDAIFESEPSSVGLFPCLHTLSLDGISSISLSGLEQYLTRRDITQTLRSLTLNNTALPPQSLHRVLSLGRLTTLSYRSTVSRSFASGHSTPLLSSRTLKTLKFEILDSEDARNLASPSPSYYVYLIDCLLASNLPALQHLYVRDSNFQENLSRAQADAGPFASPWSHTMTLYTKPEAEHIEWTKYTLSPAAQTGSLTVTPVFQMPRNSFVAPDNMEGFLAAAAAGQINLDDDDVLRPPAPGFAEGRLVRPKSTGNLGAGLVGAGNAALGVGGKNGGWKRHSRGLSNISIGSQKSALGGLVPPSPGFAKKKENRGSRDFWGE